MTEAELDWLRAEFDRCQHWIQAALDRDIGTHNIDDVWEAIESGQAQLWPCAHAAVVTIRDEHPRLTALRVWLAGGSLAEIEMTAPAVIRFAEKNDYHFLMTSARRGWLRVFRKYGLTEAYTVMKMKLPGAGAQ